jgi:hypothetical protein
MSIKSTSLVLVATITCSGSTIGYSFGDFAQSPGDGASILASGQSGTITSELGDNFETGWTGSVMFGSAAQNLGLFTLDSSIGGTDTSFVAGVHDDLSAGVHSLSVCCTSGQPWATELFLDGQWKAVTVDLELGSTFISGTSGQTVPFSIPIDLKVSLAPEPATPLLLGVGLFILAAARWWKRRRSVHFIPARAHIRPVLSRLALSSILLPTNLE